MENKSNTTTNIQMDADSSLFTLDVVYWEQILLAILVGLIAITGLIGNSMIIAAVAFSKNLQTSTNALVTNLSIADLLTSFTMIWFAVSVLGDKEEWPIPQAYWICEVSGFMVYSYTGTSMWTLGLIAINRLLYIIKPDWYNKMFSPRKLLGLVLTTWVIPAVILLIPLATGDVIYGYNTDGIVCASIRDTDEFVYTQLAVGLSLPLPAIFVSYILIYLHVKKHFRAQKQRLPKFGIMRMEETESSGRQNTTPRGIILEKDTTIELSRTFTVSAQVTKKKQRLSKQEIDITKNLFIVVVAFFACFIPYFIALSLRNVMNVEHYYLYIKSIPFVNSAINFMIYASKHPNFKVVIGHMLRCSYADIPQPSPLLKYLLSKRQ